MKCSLEIRQAGEADASEIAELIYSTSVACCFTADQPCPEWYKQSTQPSQIADLLKSEKMAWLVAVQDQKIAGVLAVSDKTHVKYFFVHPAQQKAGIGKKLWHFALQNEVLGNALTVRSSLFAVPVYQRLGFEAVEAPQTFNGMPYQTMKASYT